MTFGLGDKVLALHLRLTDVAMAHAFGGALALAYCTEEPRGTKAIDVNVFVGTDRAGSLAEALGPEVRADRSALELLRRDGQARLWWDSTPVDVFLSNHPFHDRAQERVRRVPFGDHEGLPVLACEDLAVFKALFARPKDALDLAMMAVADSIDLDALRSHVATLMGSHADRAVFFARVADTVDELRRS